MPGCCTTERYGHDELDLFASHTANCCKQFECNECSTRFTNLESIVEHYRKIHHKNAEEIRNEWHTTKRIFNDEPIMKMRFSLPNGLVLTRESIEDTDFYMKLKSDLIRFIQRYIWPQEADTIQELCDV